MKDQNNYQSYGVLPRNGFSKAIRSGKKSCLLQERTEKVDGDGLRWKTDEGTILATTTDLSTIYLALLTRKGEMWLEDGEENFTNPSKFRDIESEGAINTIHSLEHLLSMFDDLWLDHLKLRKINEIVNKPLSKNKHLGIKTKYFDDIKDVCENKMSMDGRSQDDEPDEREEILMRR